MSGPSTSYPTTTIGQSAEKTITLTANSALTVNGISTGSGQFIVGTAKPALPASLGAGQTLQVPVTFKPTGGGLQAATLTVETSTGTFTFSLQGTGQPAEAKIEASPAVLSFGGTSVGGKLSSAATFRNVGGAPLTIESIGSVAAPFVVSGAPAPGKVLQPGEAVNVEVSFEPTAEGNFSGELVLHTSAGSSAIALAGSAGQPGVLKFTPEKLEYGNVQVGSTASKSFSITNTGGTNVTITKSKPPLGGSYTATSTLSEGTTIAPGETVTETVAFTPGAPGYNGGTWALNGTDVSGLHEEKLAGNGTVPAPGAGWSHNGSATISAGVIQTTPATSNQAGSAFFEKPMESRHLAVEFDQTIGSGTGADGQTLTFADATKAAPTALGEAGGGLGFAGISGIAVAFDTYKNSANPSSNFVGISDGRGTSGGLLHWLATSTSVPALRTGTHHVKVETLNNTITVWVDGTQALSSAVTLPSQVLLGFTGGTGGLTDAHKAANVSVAGEATPKEEPPKEEPKEEPKPSTLKITDAISAPSGSPQAEAQLTYGGTCPSSFTTGALANGGAATPALSGAVQGASCSVSESAPSGSGWKTTASVNGAAPVELSLSGGKLTVPGFALLAGANTVAFANTYTPPKEEGGAPSIPDPSAGGWQLNGNALLESPNLVLTTAATNQAGSGFWPTAVDPRNLDYEFTISIGGGSGADGLAFVIADATKAAPTALGEGGGGLGFAGISGIAVAFDTFQNSANPSNNFIGVSDGAGTTAGTLHWLTTSTSLPSSLRTGTHKIRIDTSGGGIAVWMDGTKVANVAATMPSSAYVGFSGGTGGSTDRHAISGFTAANAPKEEPPKEEPKPATLKITNAISAPSGSPQAEAQLTYSGTCPSSFTTGALANGGAASPSLTGAVEGASCSVSENAPSGSGWKTTASVNGAAPVELSVSGGKLTVPSFALAAGANTVAFANTYTPPKEEGGVPSIPDPSKGGWQLNGNALLEGTSLVLTTAAANQAGSAFWPTKVDPRSLSFEFTISIGGGSGADGLAFVIADATRGATATSLGEKGGGLGFAKTAGWAVAFDTYKNSANPSNNFAGISDGAGTSAGTLHWLTTFTPLASSLRTGTHKVKVDTAGGAIAVWLDGTKLGSTAVTLPSSAFVGFSGGTGGSTDRHAVSGLTVGAG